MFPLALQYGMTSGEFWEQDPRLFNSYRISFVKKMEFNKEVTNHNSWLQGMYFYEAIIVSLNNSFSKQSTAKYTDKPYDLKEKNSMKNPPILNEELKDNYWANLGRIKKKGE